jgi:hypothetical protein
VKKILAWLTATATLVVLTAAATGLASSRPASTRTTDPRITRLQTRVTRLETLLRLTIARENIQASQIISLQSKEPALNVTNSLSLSTTVPGGFQYTTAKSIVCPGGSQVISGWYQADHGVTPVASYPGIGNDWEVTFWNPLGVAAVAKVSAICAAVG